jgi:hypothetical protein
MMRHMGEGSYTYSLRERDLTPNLMLISRQ